MVRIFNIRGVVSDVLGTQQRHDALYISVDIHRSMAPNPLNLVDVHFEVTSLGLARSYATGTSRLGGEQLIP
jgi:hypothetical protein